MDMGSFAFISEPYLVDIAPRVIYNLLIMLNNVNVPCLVVVFTYLAIRKKNIDGLKPISEPAKDNYKYKAPMGIFHTKIHIQNQFTSVDFS